MTQAEETVNLIVEPKNRRALWKEALHEASHKHNEQLLKENLGKTFGNLTLTGYGGDKYADIREKWLFSCSCGRTDIPRVLSLVMDGRVKSCGCLKLKGGPKKHYKDLTGQKFGKLTAKNLIEGKPVKYQCTCDCGGIVEVYMHNLTQGRTTHCGCERVYKNDVRVMVKIGVTEMSLSDWAKFLGVSRQRAFQLHKKNILVERGMKLLT